MATFEVRLKKTNGHIVSRHFKDIKDQGKAAKRAEKLGVGRILSVRKVHAFDIIGTIESMGLRDIIGVQAKQYNEREGIVFENTSIGEIVFSKSKRMERRTHSKKRKREKEYD